MICNQPRLRRKKFGNHRVGTPRPRGGYLWSGGQRLPTLPVYRSPVVFQKPRQANPLATIFSRALYIPCRSTFWRDQPRHSRLKPLLQNQEIVGWAPRAHAEDTFKTVGRGLPTLQVPVVYSGEVMDNRYFHAELDLLQELASEFALANPVLAPLLDGSRTDPDVERLLEAVAFQNALLRRKLDCDFPELVHSLAQLLLPHYLRPIPASTIIGFTPHAFEGQPSSIPAGTELAFAPIEGTRCRFRTIADLELHPLELIDASFAEPPGQPAKIRLSLALKDLPLRCWQPRALRLFLADDHAFASELYLLLSRHVSRVLLTPGGGSAAFMLPAGSLRPTGFADDEELLPYPLNAFPGYRMLQEYFSMPEKFLFFELAGWEQWQERGEGMHFSISFQLDNLPFRPQRVRRLSFALNAVPAINLFPHDADPISIDHRAGSYQIRPAGANPAHCQVFSVDRVTGYSRAAARERSYVPFEFFSCDSSTEPLYQTRLTQSIRHGGSDIQLGVAFPAGLPPPGTEVLSIALTCSNGSLPERLCIGDIAEPLSSLPDLVSAVSARSITPIKPGQPPPLGPGMLWRLTSHLYLNQLSLERVEHLRALLELYVFPGHGFGVHGAANLMRISGIEELYLTAGEERNPGLPMRGAEIRIKLRQDHFAGPGDIYLFGCVLDHFLGCYVSLQSYTRLVFHDTLSRRIFQWPTRLGNQLIR